MTDNNQPLSLDEIMDIVNNSADPPEEIITERDKEAIEKISKEITFPALNRDSKNLEKETTEVIQLITQEAIAEVTGRQMPHKAERITEEIITRLNDQHNQIGQLFMQKKILKHQGRLFKKLMELSMGIRVVKMEKGKPVIYEIPPNENVIWKLLSYIDGSKSNTFVKATKTTKSNDIDAMLGGKHGK